MIGVAEIAVFGFLIIRRNSLLAIWRKAWACRSWRSCRQRLGILRYHASGCLNDTLSSIDRRGRRVKELRQDRRNGLRISSALAESAMSHLVNQRLGKRQPMRWSAEGAHLLLQVRCADLDNRLEMLFREWLPKFRRQSPPPLLIGCRPQL